MIRQKSLKMNWESGIENAKDKLTFFCKHATQIVLPKLPFKQIYKGEKTMLPWFAAPAIAVWMFSGSVTRFIAKQKSDVFISGKIEEKIEELRELIRTWFIKYKFNMFITIFLNLTIATLALVSHFFFTVNSVVIFVIASISLFMILRTMVNFTIALFFTIVPNWHNIFHYGRIFFMNLFDRYGIEGSIKDTIHVAFSTIYHNNTSGFTRGIHSVFSKLRFVKSADEISEEIQTEIYNLITGYTVRIIIYRIIAFLIYCALFMFLLRPFVFSHTMSMNALEVILYPFVIATPEIINILRSNDVIFLVLVGIASVFFLLGIMLVWVFAWRKRCYVYGTWRSSGKIFHEAIGKTVALAVFAVYFCIVFFAVLIF